MMSLLPKPQVSFDGKGLLAIVRGGNSLRTPTAAGLCGKSAKAEARASVTDRGKLWDSSQAQEPFEDAVERTSLNVRLCFCMCVFRVASLCCFRFSLPCLSPVISFLSGASGRAHGRLPGWSCGR